MKKYFSLLGSLVIMVCLGGIYAWSIFVHPLKLIHGLSTAQTQIIFGFTVAIFTISMLFAGRFEKKYGARLTVFISAILFILGYTIASFSNGSFYLIFFGIAILSGKALGFGYITALSVPMQWFPNKKGLITGISAASFGGGAVFLSHFGEFLLKFQIPILKIFLIIGLTYGFLIFIAGLIMYTPKEKSENNNEKIEDIRILLKTKQYWLLFIAMFTGTFAGLLVIGNLKPIGISLGLDAKSVMFAISSLSIGNALGRVVWGYLSDFIKTKYLIIVSLIFLSLVTFVLIVVHPVFIIFMIFTFLIGFAFGANFVLYASAVSSFYGINFFSSVYPFVFLSYGVAGAIGPYLGGKIFDLTNSYTYSILLSAVICLVGASLYFILSPKKQNMER